MKACKVCVRHANPTNVCGACEAIVYCSDKCADMDWPSHQFVCKTIKWSEIVNRPGILELYNKSKNVLEQAKLTDNITWICLGSFLSASYINTTVQMARENWKVQNLVYPPQLMSDDGDEIQEDLFEAVLGDWYLISLSSPNGKEEAIKAAPALEYLWALPVQLRLKLYMTSLYALITKQMPPLSAPLVVYRGYTALVASAAANSPVRKLEDFRPGDEWVNWSFLSTSLDENVSARFIAGDCCMMRIMVPAGFPAILVSKHASDETYPTSSIGLPQAEVLLPAGLMFRFEELEREAIEITHRTKGDIMLRIARVSVIGIKTPTFF
jgi:hypothetical protein